MPEHEDNNGVTDAESASPSEEEQRRESRVRYDLPVFFYFAVGKRRPRDAEYHKAYTQDISKSGIKLLVETPSEATRSRLQDGTHLGMEVYLPIVFRSKPLNSRGVIVWADEHPEGVMLGVELTELSDSGRDTLKNVATTLRSVTDDILAEGESERDVLDSAPDTPVEAGEDSSA